jgi:hypothetical protein
MCYHTYTKFLSNDTHGTFENVYQQSYNLFCKVVIQEKILRKHKVYYLTKLCDKFPSYVSNEHASASIYSTSKLKVKLRRDYDFYREKDFYVVIVRIGTWEGYKSSKIFIYLSLIFLSVNM